MTPAQRDVWLSLRTVYEREGRATVRAVAAEAGRNVSTTHFHLRALRESGDAVWEPGRSGTLAPSGYRPVAWVRQGLPDRSPAGVASGL